MNKKLVSILIVVLVLVSAEIFFSLKNVPSGREIAEVTHNNPVIVTNVDKKASIKLVDGPVVSSLKSALLGEYLTDTKGMTLYVTSDDKLLQSSCVDECLKAWPPFTYDNKNIESSTDVLSKRISLLKRDDGTFQYAYDKKPLYYSRSDKKPGDTTGNYLGGRWTIVVIK